MTAPARVAASEIVRALRDAGHTAYFAGGCVRDELLGRVPSDYDVATDAPPGRVQAIFRRTAAVGAAFGVILVKLHGEVVEVATFRADGAYTDARRPDSVAFSTPKADAQRRDFTVNALFLDPLDTAEDAMGRVIDFVGGRADLAAKTLRAVGNPDQRLQEDHLRALRAVRLAAKLGFEIDAHTADAITRHAQDLRGVSRERIGDELRLIFGLPGRAAAVANLHRLGLAPAILMTDRSRPVFGRAAEAQPALSRLHALNAAASPVAGLAAWTLDLEPDLAAADVKSLVSHTRKALCLSNLEQESLEGALTLAIGLREAWAPRPVAMRKRLASNPRFWDAHGVLAAESPGSAAAIEADVRALEHDGIGLAPKPLLTGDDLVRAGRRPGPQFRTVLERVYDAQLEGRVREKAAAMELASAMFV